MVRSQAVLTLLYRLPRQHHKHLNSTNCLERVNQEIKRRTKVVRIFPNEASAQRLIGALLAEKHETWSTGKKYFDMAEYLEARGEGEQQEIEEEIQVAR